jgi:hypothetical protein
MVDEVDDPLTPTTLVAKQDIPITVLICGGRYYGDSLLASSVVHNLYREDLRGEYKPKCIGLYFIACRYGIL